MHCNYKAISDYSLGAAEDIIETLFWLEESAASLPARGKGTRFPEYTAPGNLIHLTAMTPAKLHIAEQNGRIPFLNSRISTSLCNPILIMIVAIPVVVNRSF